MSTVLVTLVMLSLLLSILILGIMEIKVFMTQNSERPVFDRIVESVDIDFQQMLYSLRVLFGDGCIVEFKVTL